MDKSVSNTTVEALPTAPNVPHIDEPTHPTDQAISYILLPICSFGVILVLTISVLLFIQRRRRLERLRHRLMPFYNFAPGDEEDWEAELLESEGELTVKRVKIES